MFIVSLLEDTVAVAPRFMNGGELRTIKRELRRRYVNRVLPGLGLCCALYEVDRVEQGPVYPGRGEAYLAVVFRLVVFKPFEGEIVDGFIGGATDDGIRLSLVFFDMITVPSELLAPSSCVVERSASTDVWFARFPDGSRREFTPGQPCRFRIHKVVFRDERAVTGSQLSLEDEGSAAAALISGGLGDDSTTRKGLAPIEIVASMAEEGLGLFTWRSQLEAAEATVGIADGDLGHVDEGDYEEEDYGEEFGDEEEEEEELVDEAAYVESSGSAGED